MSKLSKALRALGRIVRDPWLLNKVLDEDANYQRAVHARYRAGGGLPVVQLTALLGDLDETIFPYASLDGSSLPSDLALLKGLAARFENCSYFEIGTWRGESVANVAAVAQECYTLNLSATHMKELGMGQKYIDLHRHFSTQLRNVTHLEGDSRTFDYAGLGRKFDLVFIDGDHHYKTVRSDTQMIFQHLLHDSSIVVWHDYAFNPEKVRYEVLHGILDGMPPEAHGKLYHVANTMCAVYLHDKPASTPFSSPQKPRGAFEVRLTWKQAE